MHARSNHALTLRPPAATEFVKALPDRPIGEARGGFLLTYEPDGQALRVTAERGPERASGRIDWIIGAGDQGLTPLVSLNRRWLEHRLSYYPKAGRFDLTLGHAPGASRTAADALGIAQPETTIRACLGCHSTVANQSIRVETPGVGCERCHPAAAGHYASPAQLAAREQVTLCAECHRLEGPDDKFAIRFQPLRLVKSRCFTQGGVSCVGCHSAHQNAVRNDADYYRSRCLSCHASEHAQSKQDCLPCHMPKSSPAPYLQFTDHYIRRIAATTR